MVKTISNRIRSVLFCSVLVTAVLLVNPLQASSPDAISVEITSHLGDQQTFVEGDVISFLMSLDQAAYVYLFYRDAANNLIQLFPNQKTDSHFYQAGFYQPVPPTKSHFQFKIQAPFGQEQIWVLVSDNAQIQLQGRQLKNGLRLMNDPVEKLQVLIRDQSTKAFGFSRMDISSQAR